VNKLWTAAEDLNEEAPEAHHVEAAFVETVLYVCTLFLSPTLDNSLLLEGYLALSSMFFAWIY